MNKAGALLAQATAMINAGALPPIDEPMGLVDPSSTFEGIRTNMTGEYKHRGRMKAARRRYSKPPKSAKTKANRAKNKRAKQSRKKNRKK